jgi:hypothetical protein
MSKTILSPVAKWKGSVVIADPLTFPQSVAFEDALEAAKAADSLTKQNSALLPGICACVEKWELEGLGQVTPETFPSTPRAASAQLIAWLVSEIAKLYADGNEIPNA